jgi:hypothetical protein
MTARTVTLGAGAPHERDELRIVASTEMLAAVSEIARAVGSMTGGERLAHLLAQRLTAAQGEHERESRILDAMLPPIETLTDAAAIQLRRNALARAVALTELGALTSAQLAELRGAKTANPHTTTSRWLSAGRVFAIDTAAGRLFPAFQFAEGKPRPVISRVLGALRGQVQGWELLLWFTGSNGYLDGARPVDRLAEAPDEVVAAAAYQASLSED